MKIRVQLPEQWIEYLTHQSESGMGYQRVDVVFEDETRLMDCVVFNAEQIEVPEAHAQKKIESLTIRGDVQ